MARLRYNGVVAELGAGLSAGATTITFASALTYNGGTNVPTVSGNYIPLSIMGSSGELAEIVWLTAYTSGALTGTITRGQEGTSDSTHAVGRTVIHAPNVKDLDDLITKETLDANSILYAVSDNTPAALAVAASRFVGRKASGDVAAMTGAEAWALLAAATGHPEVIGVAMSDETTAITTGTAKVTMRMPFAMTLTAVRASVNTASTASGPVTVDINEGGSTILSTKLTIDDNEKTSTTAATAAVISDASLADDAEITFDIDTAGTGAKGLKVWLIGTRA